MPEELQVEVCDIVQEAVINTIPCKRNEKWQSDEDLQRGEKRREAKRKEEMENYTHLNAETQRISRKK